MDTDAIVEKMQAAVSAAGGLDNSVKFDFGDDGCVVVDGTSVSSEDAEVDCTIGLSKENFIKLATGKLDPMMAFMTGKLKVSGDMSVAIGLQKLFSSL